MLTTNLVIRIILAEKNEDKIYVDQDESLTDLHICNCFRSPIHKNVKLQALSLSC